jgi:hypothetical protein
MEVMVNTVVLSTDRAWTRFEIEPGPQRIKNSPFNGKRVKGIEPSCPAWEAGVLPLNYTRKPEPSDFNFRLPFSNRPNHCQNRTSPDPLIFSIAIFPLYSVFSLTFREYGARLKNSKILPAT